MDQKSAREFPTFFGGPRRQERLAVILAGGDGSRLKSLTRAITGDERPKQFCPILGGHTLLDETRKRVALSIPAEQTYFSLTLKHERFYRRSLWGVADDRLIVQPDNKGTAPAILYSLMRLYAGSPDSVVAFFPSDHYFSDNAAFMSNVDSAFAAAERDPRSIVLIGMEPEKAETSYGWIEPAESLFGGLAGSVSRVKKFWEKPTQNTAKKLLASGCLWNSFVMVGKVRTFLDMFERQLPDMYKVFASAGHTFGTTNEAPAVRAIYSRIRETNFSSEVLERSSDELLVMRVADVGWSDWGEPHRVLGTLTDLGVQMDWMHAIAA